MNEIMPRLFLGSIHAFADRDALAAHGITHILSVVDCDIGHRQRVLRQPSREEPFTRLVIAASDTTSSRLDRHFEAGSAFIAEGLATGSVLVHCKAGQSRSATMVIAHLMREERWSVLKTLHFVQQRRPLVQPNVGFMEQLRAFEVRLGLQDSENCTLSSDEAAATDVVPDVAEEAEAACKAADECAIAVSTADVQVEVADMFGVNETRLRCERFRSRCQRLRTPAGLLGVAAPLRKRRYK